MSGSSTLKLSSANGPFIADGINEGTQCSVVAIEFRPKGFNVYRVSFAGGEANRFTYHMHLNGIYRDSFAFTFTEIDDTENQMRINFLLLQQ